MNPNLMMAVALATALSVICILLRPGTARTQRFGQKWRYLWFLLVMVVCGSWFGIYHSNRPYQTAVKNRRHVEPSNAAT